MNVAFLAATVAAILAIIFLIRSWQSLAFVLDKFNHHQVIP